MSSAELKPPPSTSTSTSNDVKHPSSSSKSSYEMPYVEKYRPKSLEDVVGNEETLMRLRAIAQDGNMPNLILSGPPGSGKTTSMHALARQLLGSSYPQGVLELNASDARGIDVVRNKIKTFAMNKVQNMPPGRHKIIILDEADSMTSAAQQALRRTMEIYSHTTRFALACNQSTKIIEPIQSRGAILRFTRLSDEQVLFRLKYVCAAEQLSYTPDGLEALVFTAEGDMRNALNNLQATQSGFGFVNQTNVFKVCDQPHPQIIRNIVDSCLGVGGLENNSAGHPNSGAENHRDPDTSLPTTTGGNTRVAINQMIALCNTGYSPSDIIGTFFKVVKAHDKMGEAIKLEYLKEIGFTHMRIAEGVNSLLQLLGLVSRLCQKSELIQQG